MQVWRERERARARARGREDGREGEREREGGREGRRERWGECAHMDERREESESHSLFRYHVKLTSALRDKFGHIITLLTDRGGVLSSDAQQSI